MIIVNKSNVPAERLLRYHYRTMELLAALCHGRNRMGTDTLLDAKWCERLNLHHETLLQLAESAKVPYIIRRLAVRLLLVLYIDREPREAKPMVRLGLWGGR